jgi:hypothetical protein
MNSTVTLQIGNTDNKLSQQEWSAFYKAIDNAVSYFARRVHFSGCSSSDEPRQNACWVFEIDNDEELRSAITRIRQDHRQDSAAWSVGVTEFL